MAAMHQQVAAPSLPPLRFKPAAGSSPTIGMAPLVDVVLLLICFYLFVAKSVADLEDQTIQLPVVRHEAVELKPGELVINLRADGRTFIAGQEVSTHALRASLAALLAAAPEAGQPAVVVRADRSLPFNALAQLQEVCREVGVGRLILRTIDQE